MPRETKTVIIVALTAILSACQSQPVTYYIPPAGTLLEDSATLVGSRVTIRNIFYADEITYVFAIDELPVEGGARNYDNPIPLLLGSHLITVGFAQGSGCAKATFELDVQSRKTYVARGEKLGRESIFRQENLRIWIEDNEGNRVTNDATVKFDYCGGGFGLIIV
jgi:hypothetical protein